MANEQLGIVVRTFDEATATLKRIDQSLLRVGASAKRSADGVSSLDKVFGNLRGRMRTAFEFHVVNRGLLLLEQGLHKVARAIPDLISKGEQWAAVVDDVADATGLAADKASELAAVQRFVGGSTEGLSRGLVQLAKNAATNRKAFDDLGIATRDANGDLLSADVIFQNVRRRISATGTSLLSTAAGQKVFGRGAKDLLDILTLTNRQWAIYAAEARRSGLILTEQGLRAAEQWGRTRQQLDLAFTGIGAQVLQGVAPSLIALTNGIARAIQQNMDRIVRFVVQVVNFVAGVVGGFLGIDFQLITLADSIERAGNSAKGAALDVDDLAGSTDKADKATDRANARLRERRRLLRSLAEAERALAREKNRFAFGGDKSNLEAELERQSRAARIREARERIAEARKAIAEHRSDAAERVRIAGVAAQAAGLKWRTQFGPGGSVSKGVTAGLTEAMRKAAEEARRSGSTVARSILDAILGPETIVMLGSTAATQRTGGLVTQMQNVATFLASLGGHIDNLNKLLGNHLPGLIAALVGLRLVMMVPGAGLLGGAMRGAAGAAATGARAGARNVATGGAIGGVAVAQIINSILRAPGPQQPDEYGGGAFGGMTAYDMALAAAGGPFGRAASGARGALGSILGSIFNGKPSGDWKAGLDWDAIQNAIPGASNRYPNPNQNPELFPTPGAGFAGASTSGIDVLGRNLRRFWGESSPVVTAQRDTQTTTQGVADNTVPIGTGSIGIGSWAAGALGVTNSLFGAVTNWTAGRLGITDISNKVTVGGTAAGGSVGVSGTVGVGTAVVVTGANGGTVGTTVNNTVGVGGTVTANNSLFGNIGKVVQWAAGTLGVAGTVTANNSAFSGIGSISNWTAGTLPVGGSVYAGNALFNNIGKVVQWAAGTLPIAGNVSSQISGWSGVGAIPIMGGVLDAIVSNTRPLSDGTLRIGNKVAVGVDSWGVSQNIGTAINNANTLVPVRTSGTSLSVGIANTPGVRVENKPNVDVANKPSVNLPKGDPWQDAMLFQSTLSRGYLGSILTEGKRKDYATFATGTDYVPRTGSALIHKGEMIIPASIADKIRRGQTAAMVGQTNARAVGGGGGDSVTNLAVYLDSRVIAREMGIRPGGNSTIRVQPAV